MFYLLFPSRRHHNRRAGKDPSAAAVHRDTQNSCFPGAQDRAKGHRSDTARQRRILPRGECAHWWGDPQHRHHPPSCHGSLSELVAAGIGKMGRERKRKEEERDDRWCRVDGTPARLRRQTEKVDDSGGGEGGRCLGEAKRRRCITLWMRNGGGGVARLGFARRL